MPSNIWCLPNQREVIALFLQTVTRLVYIGGRPSKGIAYSSLIISPS